MKSPRKNRKKEVSDTDPVEVHCRVRPLHNPNDDVCLDIVSSTCVQLIPNNTQYQFQHVFDEMTDQSSIFNHISKPLIEDLLHGKNGLLFTYGVTSSGKTYTMIGDSKEPGLLPRTIHVLFNAIGKLQAPKYSFLPDGTNGFMVQSEADAMLERQKELFPQISIGTPTRSSKTRGGKTSINFDLSQEYGFIDDINEDNYFSVFVSYVEIYNNYVYDLLENPSNPLTSIPQSKALREDESRQMYISGVTEVEVKNTTEAFEILESGNQRRRMAHTLLNSSSSRAHSIFTIRLIQAVASPTGTGLLLNDPNYMVQQEGKEQFSCISQLSMVDLAGSERTDRTGNAGDRLREAGNINKSLMNLRTCLEILRNNQKNATNEIVPYRNCKLTHLFKQFFEGIGKVKMIVCVNPQASEFDENVHVLQFAELSQEVEVARASRVKLAKASKTTDYAEIYKKALEEASRPIAISNYVLGSPLPQVGNPCDAPLIKLEILTALKSSLLERAAQRDTLLEEERVKHDAFRARLVENYQTMMRLDGSLTEAKNTISIQGAELRRAETRIQTLESENQRLRTRLTMLNAEHRSNDRFRDVQTPSPANLRNRIRPTIPPNKPSTPRAHAVELPPERPEEKAQRNNNAPPMTGRVRQLVAENNARTKSDGRNPVCNPRHRRSVSQGRVLDHRPGITMKLDTVLQPRPQGNVSGKNGRVGCHLSRRRSRSVTNVTKGALRKSDQYVLTEQNQDENGDISTTIHRGDVIPTPGGGSAVIFKDVERHTISPAGATTKALKRLSNDNDEDMTPERKVVRRSPRNHNRSFSAPRLDELTTSSTESSRRRRNNKTHSIELLDGHDAEELESIPEDTNVNNCNQHPTDFRMIADRCREGIEGHSFRGVTRRPRDGYLKC